jgi:hypothetical protein
MISLLDAALAPSALADRWPHRRGADLFLARLAGPSDFLSRYKSGGGRKRGSAVESLGSGTYSEIAKTRGSLCRADAANSGSLRAASLSRRKFTMRALDVARRNWGAAVKHGLQRSESAVLRLAPIGIGRLNTVALDGTCRSDPPPKFGKTKPISVTESKDELPIGASHTAPVLGRAYRRATRPHRSMRVAPSSRHASGRCGSR